MEVPIWVLVAMGLAIGLLGLMLWTNLRERPFRVKVPDLDDFEQALPSIAGMTRTVILEGNTAEIVQNGDGYFPALWKDFAAAREAIHYETFVWERGEVCDRMAEAFIARARDGVEVRLMVDAMGSNKKEPELFERLHAAGVKVAIYHPLSLRDIGQLNKRTHRKLAIVDGRVGYVCGHGVAPHWTGNGQDKDHWRDTGVRVTGPIVNAIQSVFAQHWIEETGEVLVGEKHFPHLEPTGDARMHILAGANLASFSDLELMFQMALATVQKELLIQNPYFIPDRDTIRLVKRAVARGVDVHIMVPGPVTDSPVVSHAGHRYFGELLDCGVHLYEHQKTLTHQKILVIDDLWCHVGSTNFDDRSFDINEEAGLGIIDPACAATLKEAFENDRKNCVELKADAWKKRCGFRHRMIDRACYLLSGQL
ncbi:MAG: phospholipase D-like domain-containing protein [Acidobacteriota bacterium]